MSIARMSPNAETAILSEAPLPCNAPAGTVVGDEAGVGVAIADGVGLPGSGVLKYGISTVGIQSRAISS